MNKHRQSNRLVHLKFPPPPNGLCLYFAASLFIKVIVSINERRLRRQPSTLQTLSRILSTVRSHRNLFAQAAPKIAAPPELLQANILKSMVHNHKFFPGTPYLWNTRLRRVSQFVRIRIARLEKACKGTCIALIHYGIRFLYCVDAVPLMSRLVSRYRGHGRRTRNETYVNCIAAMRRRQNRIFTNIPLSLRI